MTVNLILLGGPRDGAEITVEWPPKVCHISAMGTDLPLMFGRGVQEIETFLDTGMVEIEGVGTLAFAVYSAVYHRGVTGRMVIKSDQYGRIPYQWTGEYVEDDTKQP